MYDVSIILKSSYSKRTNSGVYAAVLSCGDRVKTVTGSREGCNRNRIPIVGLIEAVSILKKPSNIQIVTSSKYLFRTIEDLDRLELNAFVGPASSSQVSNADLLSKLTELRKTGFHQFQIFLDEQKGEVI